MFAFGLRVSHRRRSSNDASSASETDVSKLPLCTTMYVNSNDVGMHSNSVDSCSCAADTMQIKIDGRRQREGAMSDTGEAGPTNMNEPQAKKSRDYYLVGAFLAYRRQRNACNDLTSPTGCAKFINFRCFRRVKRKAAVNRQSSASVCLCVLSMDLSSPKTSFIWKIQSTNRRIRVHHLHAPQQ